MAIHRVATRCCGYGQAVVTTIQAEFFSWRPKFRGPWHVGECLLMDLIGSTRFGAHILMFRRFTGEVILYLTMQLVLLAHFGFHDGGGGVPACVELWH